MSTAKIIEITSESPDSYEDAIERGIKEASRTIENIQSAWVKDHEVLLRNGQDRKHRVSLKVTFIVDSSEG